MIRILEKHGLPDDATRQALFFLHEAIFGKPAGKKVQERLNTVPDLLVLLAETADGQLAGFKIGYRQDPGTYYSWLGGVLTEFRRQGIAEALMQHQHEWARRQGYLRIQTKTMNRWRSMLILNIQSGFDIIGTYQGMDGSVRIILQKELKEKRQGEKSKGQ